MTVSIMKRTKKFLRSAAILLLWLLIWQLAALLINQQILIPTPFATLKALLRLGVTGKFYISVLLSLARIVCGFSFGVICKIFLFLYYLKIIQQFIGLYHIPFRFQI